MSSQNLFPNSGAAPEESVGRHGDWRAIGIVSALSGLAAVVSLVALLFTVRELALMRDQQATFMKDIQDQQMLLRSQLQDLKNKMESRCSCTESTIATPVTMTTEPQVTLVETMTTESQVTPVVTMTTAPPTVVDCSALYASGQTTSGVYTLGPGVQAYCDMETAGGGWTVIQRRQDGSVPFNRTWEEYKLGFGDPNGEYWLGNDNIHLLTSQKDYTLRVDLMDWEGQRKNAQYSFFKVSGESDQYRLHTISGYSGTAGNSMSPNKGYRFSTVDRDNDYDGLRHCAQAYGQGGWWYGACSGSLLNGLYYRGCGNSCPPWQGVVWHHWRGWRYSLKAVSMKIRPW
uniref:Fibrinogen C-terminal domain-containing protein n=1 Tax=Branchiostoma floridae TaxID=7739 RepID=C3YX21_BRAFL|eukprot:XP_002599027.1 hypothetical protein BRAFLDRAFT_104277 [Branchiostoma floridae]